jgi:hypothetical protein
VCVCVGEIISLPWFSKELKNDLSKNSCLRGVILILLVRESIFVGWGSPFPIVLVPRYKLSLCHTPIKLHLLGFPGIDVFACGLRDHVTRFASRFFSYKYVATSFGNFLVPQESLMSCNIISKCGKVSLMFQNPFLIRIPYSS